MKHRSNTVMVRGSPYPHRLVGAALGATMLALCFATTAEARVCGPRDMIIDRLTDKYEEKQSAVGVSGNGVLTELFVSKVGTWTIVFTQPDGTSCLMAAGENWETTAIPEADGRDGKDTES